MDDVTNKMILNMTRSQYSYDVTGIVCVRTINIDYIIIHKLDFLLVLCLQ